MSRHRTVSDIMTRNVVTVEPTASFKEIARLMDGFGISGLPVVGLDERPAGVVTEADLLMKEAHPAAGAQSPHMIELPRHRSERRKAVGLVASELMTSPAVTVGRDASLAEAARLMTTAGVKRLVVVDDRGRLAGIVSREDMIGVFLRPDADIREEIVDDVIQHDWMMDARRFTVTVLDGVVSLQGRVERRSLIEPLAAAVAAVDGVIAMDTRLTWDEDDTQPRVLDTIASRAL
jgi:CBS-domain-containing membrane protein